MYLVVYMGRIGYIYFNWSIVAGSSSGPLLFFRALVIKYIKRAYLKDFRVTFVELTTSFERVEHGKRVQFECLDITSNFKEIGE